MSRWNPYEEDETFLSVLYAKAASRNIPISGVVSLTARCNLKCVHCYAVTSKEKHQQELDTASFKRVFDEIAEFGCLSLVITGGEPMAHPDFKELYSYAKKCGFIITLFSNATLIDEDMVLFLKKFPPRYVDISIYGATEATYESITGVKGSYQHCLDGIEILLRNDIKVRLKSVLMKPNVAEFSQLRELAASYGLPFRIDPTVFGRFSGDKSPLNLRISPDDGAACEVKMDGFKDGLKKEFDKTLLHSDKLYNCGAGKSTFSVTEDGMLRPCLMVLDIEADLREYSFKDAWKQVSENIVSLKALEGDKCRVCDMRAICGYCPPMGKLSAFGEKKEKEYFCELGRARKNLI